MSQPKRQDLINYFKVGVTLKSWVLVCLKDPYYIIALAFLKRKEKELMAKTGNRTISMTFMELERDSWIGLTKLRQIVKFFKECNILDFTMASEIGGTMEFKLTFKHEDEWFLTGPIKRPEQTLIFTEVLFPEILWTDRVLAPVTPHNKLVFVYLIQNTNYENGYAFIVREEPLKSMISKSMYVGALNTLIKININEEVTNRVSRIGFGYRTFLIKNPNFWGNRAVENTAQANIQALQKAVFDFDEDKALEERSAQAIKVRNQIGERYFNEAKRSHVWNSNDEFIEDRDFEILVTFFNKGYTDGFARANEVLDKILANEPITRQDLSDAIDDVCSLDVMTKKASQKNPAKKAIMIAQARKRLKTIAPNLKPYEIDDQMDYYMQHGKFNLDVNFSFAQRPTLAPPPKKTRKQGKKRTATPSKQTKAQLVQIQKIKATKVVNTTEQNKVVDPTLAQAQIEQTVKANEVAPKKSFIKPVEEPKKETPHKRTAEEMLIAVKFPFSLIKRFRDEKNLAKLKSFENSMEDRREAIRQMEENAELAREFCQEISRHDIMDKYYFNSVDMAKFYSILSFFKHHAHLMPLDELEFYLNNYEIFDWWRLTQGMPNYKDI